MARAGVVAAVAAMLVGSTGAGILAGAALVAGGWWAYATFATDTHPAKTEHAVAVAAVAVADAAPEAPLAPVATPADEATPIAAATPAASTTSRPATRTTSGSTTSSRSTKPKPATSSGDLLADEDEWEAMGFEEAPDVAPGTPDAEEPAQDDELDAILEDLDSAPKPTRRGR